MQYLWSAVKRSTIKWGVPVLFCETSSSLGWITIVTFFLPELPAFTLLLAHYVSGKPVSFWFFQITCSHYRTFAPVAFSFQGVLLHMADLCWSFTSISNVSCVQSFFSHLIKSSCSVFNMTLISVLCRLYLLLTDIFSIYLFLHFPCVCKPNSASVPRAVVCT